LDLGSNSLFYKMEFDDFLSEFPNFSKN
jgi:hypothetical protein